MKKTNFNKPYKIFILFFLVFIQVCGGSARGGIMSTQGWSSSGSSADTLEPGKAMVLNQLLRQEGPNMPGFPRVWMEESETNYFQSELNLSGTLSASKVVPGMVKAIPGINLGIKGTSVISARFELKTSFFMIASNVPRENNNNKNKKSKKAYPEQLGNFTEFGVEDMIAPLNPRDGYRYPNVRPSYPVAGTCYYRVVALRDSSLSISLFGGKDDGIFGKLEGKSGSLAEKSVTKYSSSFNLEGDKPIKYYTKELCGKIFEEAVKESVMREFEDIAREKWIALKSECSTLDFENDSTEEGDSSCMKWHSSAISYVQKRTIPRCQIGQGAIKKCVLRARLGTSCRMYMDPKTLGYSPKYDKNRFNVVATDPTLSFPCDEKNGYTCVLDSPMEYSMGLFRTHAKAHCQKKN